MLQSSTVTDNCRSALLYRHLYGRHSTYVFLLQAQRITKSRLVGDLLQFPLKGIVHCNLSHAYSDGSIHLSSEGNGRSRQLERNDD